MISQPVWSFPLEEFIGWHQASLEEAIYICCESQRKLVKFDTLEGNNKQKGLSLFLIAVNLVLRSIHLVDVRINIKQSQSVLGTEFPSTLICVNNQ